MQSAIHATFVIDRVYDAPIRRVFQAFSDPEKKASWFCGPPGWHQVVRRLDFRVGGEERLQGRFADGTETLFDARYYEILPERRIVYVYDMYVRGMHMSVSLATVELQVAGETTRLRFTEQAVYVDGLDGSADRKQGTASLLDRITAIV